jgi:CubicO group peptidase (beta-lactamase class C family)
VPTPSVADISHYGYSWWLGDGLMSALGHAGQRIDIFRKEELIVVTLGAFPEPAYAPPNDHHRRNEVVAFTRLVRAALT